MINQTSIRDGDQPLYRQLSNILRNAIAQGTYPVHSQIPSEPELCDVYHVSRVTVRKALAELTKEGLLERHQGKGTFVSVPRMHRNLAQITSFHESCKMMGCNPGTRLIHAKKVPSTAEDQGALSVSPEDHVLEIVRLRMADDLPVALEYNRYTPRYDWLLDEDLTGSVYSLLQAHKIVPNRATHEISLTYADAHEARLLNVDAGTALLCLNEVIYDQKDKPIHSSLQKIRGDRFTFHI